MALESLRLVRFEAIHWYVRDVERLRRFMVDVCDYAEIGASSEVYEARTGMRTYAFQAGQALLLVSESLRPGSEVDRFLARHPEGIGELRLQTEDARHTFAVLDGRGGTPIDDVATLEDDHGRYDEFSIATPIASTNYRFVQRANASAPFWGFVPYDAPRGGSNRFHLLSWDHVTSNFRTLAPFSLWMEHVMGFERYWDVQFHTDGDEVPGSGLRSVVWWDPRSGVRFANNEPLRPRFNASQIQLFVDDHGGNGVQHAAWLVDDIQSAVTGLRERGAPFLPTPDAYYRYMPERLEKCGIGRIDESIEDLRRLQILVDGSAHHKYMLQIFMKDMATIAGSRDAGPFFYEIVQRKGDRGFGAGNFRALFESIEREQHTQGRA